MGFDGVFGPGSLEKVVDLLAGVVVEFGHFLDFSGFSPVKLEQITIFSPPNQ